MTGRSNCFAMTVSSSPPKSSPHFIGCPAFCRTSIASVYVMRGKGGFTLSSFATSRSSTVASSLRRFASTVWTT